MSFSQRQKTIETLLHDDTEKCIQVISSQKFISSLFYQELKSFTQMFQQVVSKKGIHLRGSNEGKNLLRPQAVIAFYSIIIMRSNMVSIRQSTISAVATKIDHSEDSVFNCKTAIENLSKIYRSLDENDKIRYVIAGLLLKVKGFNNYKMIAKDLHPDYISYKTMDIHFEGLKNQCPNLLEAQVMKHRQKWSKYLKFKPISLAPLEGLLDSLIQAEKETVLSKWDNLMQEYETETQYLLARFTNIQKSEEIEKINVDELINNFDSIYKKVTEKLKDYSTNPPKKGVKVDSNPEYDYKQFILKNYIKVYGNLLSILNKSVLVLHINWIRKIKWLFNFIVTAFVNFNIKSTVFHASVAKEYSKIIILLTQILLSYLITFKNGLFPTNKLQDCAFTEQFSIYKLAEALLYNEYPFDESDAIVFQNYQKQRKTVDNKQKQHIIDIVNFSMNSLNINPHWDNILVKLIPNLKNSHLLAKQLVNTSLYIILQYFRLTHNYQHAPKLLLMLANAKNSILATDKHTHKLIQDIKSVVYPAREGIKEGIEYFCEEYFNQYFKVNLKKNQNQKDNKPENQQQIPINQNSINTFKKTQSRDAMMQGWEQKFESVKDSPVDELNASNNNRNGMLQSGQVLNSQIFYSVKQGNNVRSHQQIQMKQIDSREKQNDEVLVPQF